MPPVSSPPAPPPVRPAARPVDGAALRGLAEPTVLDGIRTLAAVVGVPEALRLWSDAAVTTGAHGQDLPTAEHVRLVECLRATAPSAPARAAATSHLTRLRAHAVLARADVTT